MAADFPTTGLRSRWEANKQTGYTSGQTLTTVVDTGGAGHTLDTVTSTPQWVANVRGGQPVFRFDGTDDVIVGTKTGAPTGGTAFTLAVFLSSGSAEQTGDRSWPAGYDDTTSQVFALNEEIGGEWRTFVRTVGTGGGTGTVSTSGVDTRTWTLIVIEWDGTTVTLYRDNTAVSSVAIGGNLGTALTKFGLGAISPQPNARFGGDIALAASWTRALGSADRAALLDYTNTIYPAVADTTAPTVPSGVTATVDTPTQVTVSWTGSSDAVGVASYRVRRNSTDLAGATALASTARSFVDTTVVSGTNYSYTVSAVDFAGNRSAESTAATATTPTVDTTAPTVPTSVAATAVSPTQVNLTWTASTDAVGVVSYRVRRNGADLATITSGTSYSDTTATQGTAYSYTVSAVDAAGNRSAESTAATVTTPTAGRLLSRWTGSALIAQRLDRWSGSALISRVYDAILAATAYPAALGSLTDRPSWTTSTIAAGPVDQPVPTRTRTLQLPNLPAAGSDLSAAWVAYFGNQTGTTGTWAAGDRVTIPDGEWLHAGNLDVPPAVNDIEIVLGSSTGACTLTATDATSGNNTPPRIGLRVLSANNVRIRAASSAFPAVLRSLGMAGRGDKNQQGHALLEVEYCTGFRAQDLILRDSKAAGVFMYRADTYWFNRCRVERSKADAWHAANGCSYGTYSDCSSDGAGDDMMAFVHYDRSDAAVSVSHHMEVYRYTGRRNGHGRGFAVIACRDIYADQVIIEGSAAAGVIIDREARSTGSNPEQSISNVLLQRFALSGSNWSEQDHGSVFIGNGNTGGTVDARLESFHVRDNRLNQTAVRAVGSGTMTAVLKDFRFFGGLPDPANNNRTKVGGNWTSPSVMTQDNWVIDTTGPADATAPTVVINTPGHLATVAGTLTGSSGSSTQLMTNTQAIQFYVGDSPAGIASYTVTVDGSTGNGLSTPTALDSAGRGSVVWNTTTVANGQHTITVTATDTAGATTTRSVTVTVAN